MTPEVSLQLPHDRRAAAMARHALDPLSDKLHPELLDDVRLLVSELVTNSVRHAPDARGETVDLDVSLSDDTVRIEVRDRGPGFIPVGREASQDVGSGWGLFLVDELCERWGVSRADRPLVWCELRRDSEAAA